MAREILITGEVGTGRQNRQSFTGIFFYNVDPVITTAGPRVIIPTPFDTMPADIQDAGLLQPEEIDALNNGTRAFDPFRFKKVPGEINQAALARLVTRYSVDKDKFIATLRKRFAVADLFVNVATGQIWVG